MYSFWSKPGGLQELLKLALPASISQACFSIMMFTDRLLLTPLGKEAPAASMISGFTAYLFMIFFCGLLGYITPLTGQMLGSKQEEKVTSLVHQGLLISWFCYPCLLFLGNLLSPNYFEWIGISETERNLAQDYFNIINFGSFFCLINLVFASFFSGIGKTSIIMKINIVGMLINIPLSYWLINKGVQGHFKGVQGAALGSLISTVFMSLLFLKSFLNPYNKERFKTNLKLRYNKSLLKKLIQFGTATGLEMTLVFVSFSTFVALFHSYGSNEALSATIVLNWEIVAFLPACGIGLGLMSLDGKHMGAKELENAQRTVKSGLILTFLTMALACLLFFTQTQNLISIFIPQGISGASEEIMPLASIMLKLVSLYCLANAVNLILSGTLRASGDTKAVMTIAFVGDFFMLFAAYYMIKVGHWDPLLTWTIFSCSLFIQTILLSFRFWQGHWKKIEVL